MERRKAIMAALRAEEARVESVLETSTQRSEGRLRRNAQRLLQQSGSGGASEKDPLAFMRAAEKAIDEEVHRDAERVAARLEAHREELEATVGREAWAIELGVVSRDAQRAFVSAVRLHGSEDAARATAARHARKRAGGLRPGFVSRLHDVVFLLDHLGFDHSTWWRSQVVAESAALRSELAGLAAPATPAARAARRSLVRALEALARDVNLVPARGLMPRLHDMLRLAEDVDVDWGAEMRRHRRLQDERGAAQRVFRTQTAAQLAAAEAAKKVLRQPKNQIIVPESEASEREADPKAKSRVPRARALADACARAPELLRRLAKVEELPVNQETRASVRGQYVGILAECGQRGLWAVAFAAYRSMARRLPQNACSQDTYRLLISACKHARPCSSAQALQVLEEMRRRGLRPSVAVFNAVVDACAPRAEWRRAAKVLKIMALAGVGATPVTYDTLHRIAGRARREHAPAVYEAFKFAGVPEAVAYACAAAASSSSASASASASASTSARSSASASVFT